MKKWIKNRKRSSHDEESAVGRLNAHYNEAATASADLGGLRRMQTAWDISTGSSGIDTHYQDGSLDDGTDRATSVSVNSSDRSTIASGDMTDSYMEFPFENLIIGQILHEGDFTSVLKAEADGMNGSDEPQIVCVKMLKDGVQRRYSKLLRCELEMAKDIGHHPNIVSMLGSCMSRYPQSLMMEYLPNASLLRYMRCSRGATDSADDIVPPVTADQMFMFAIQTARGLAYLESNDIIHRDVAARNIFLADDLTPKLGNFDSCVEARAALKYKRGEEPQFILNRTKCVKEKWQAPERLSTGSCTTGSDAWSFGVVLWEIITLGGAPYSGVRADNMLLYLKAGKRMEQPPHCSEQLYGLVLGCWEAMPAWRPRFSQLVDSLQLLAMQAQDHIDLDAYDSQLYLKFDAEYQESQLL